MNVPVAEFQRRNAGRSRADATVAIRGAMPARTAIKAARNRATKQGSRHLRATAERVYLTARRNALGGYFFFASRPSALRWADSTNSSQCCSTY